MLLRHVILGLVRFRVPCEFQSITWRAMFLSPCLRVSLQLKALNNRCLLTYKVGDHEVIWFTVNLLTKQLISDLFLSL